MIAIGVFIIVALLFIGVAVCCLEQRVAEVRDLFKDIIPLIEVPTTVTVTPPEAKNPYVGHVHSPLLVEPPKVEPIKDYVPRIEEHIERCRKKGIPLDPDQIRRLRNSE